MLLYIASLITLAIAAIIQTTDALVIISTKPNLVFVFLVLFAHIYKSWQKRTLLILVPAFFLKFSPTLTWIVIIFIAVAFFIMALVDYFPWKHIISSIFAVALGTIVICMQAFSVNSIAIEIAFNVDLILIFFIPLQFIYEKEKEKQKTRL